MHSSFIVFSSIIAFQQTQTRLLTAVILFSLCYNFTNYICSCVAILIFETAIKAARAYEKVAIAQRVPLCKLNFPGEAPDGYTPKQKPLSKNNTTGYRGVTKNGR